MGAAAAVDQKIKINLILQFWHIRIKVVSYRIITTLLFNCIAIKSYVFYMSESHRIKVVGL